MSDKLRNKYPKLVDSNYVVDPITDGHLIVRAIGGDVVFDLPDASSIPVVGQAFTTRICLCSSSDSNCVIKAPSGTNFQQGFSEITLNTPGEAVSVCGINDPEYTGAVAWKQASRKTIYANYKINSPISGFNERVEANPLIVAFDELKTTNNQIFSLSGTQVQQGISTLVEMQYYIAFDSIFDNTYVIEAYIRKNGTEIIESSKSYVGNFGGEDVNITSPMQYLEVESGDYFELVVFHDGGIFDDQSNVVLCNLTAKTIIN